MKYLQSVKEFDVIQPNGSYEQKPDVVLLCLYTDKTLLSNRSNKLSVRLRTLLLGGVVRKISNFSIIPCLDHLCILFY